MAVAIVTLSVTWLRIDMRRTSLAHLLRKKKGAGSCAPCNRNLALVYLGSFRLFQLFNQRWHNIEKVANHGHVGDLEDRRLRIFVDRDNSARALHTDDVLNGATDAERQI